MPAIFEITLGLSSGALWRWNPRMVVALCADSDREVALAIRRIIASLNFLYVSFRQWLPRRQET